MYSIVLRQKFSFYSFYWSSLSRFCYITNINSLLSLFALITTSQNLFHFFISLHISKRLQITQLHLSNWLDGQRKRLFQIIWSTFGWFWSTEYLKDNFLLKFHLNHKYIIKICFLFKKIISIKYSL